MHNNDESDEEFADDDDDGMMDIVVGGGRLRAIAFSEICTGSRQLNIIERYLFDTDERFVEFYNGIKDEVIAEFRDALYRYVDVTRLFDLRGFDEG